MSGHHYPVVVYEHLGHTYCVPRLYASRNFESFKEHDQNSRKHYHVQLLDQTCSIYTLPGFYKVYVCSTIGEVCQFWRQTCEARHSRATHIICSTQNTSSIPHRFPSEDNNTAADGYEAIKHTYTRRGERTIKPETPELQRHGPVAPSELPRSVRNTTRPYNPPAVPSEPEFMYNSRTQIVVSAIEEMQAGDQLLLASTSNDIRSCIDTVFPTNPIKTEPVKTEPLTLQVPQASGTSKAKGKAKAMD
ncbi:hypothetical protein R3P38DRAFT_3178539 [Favolaschia claudopus]|uniref:Uncharacterized protein n=1 Tax=Favolaschia claudopus TaxID=2862362 RepID=A0AAW0CWT9_9AGAR